jgi:hypothetical protein
MPFPPRILAAERIRRRGLSARRVDLAEDTGGQCEPDDDQHGAADEFAALRGSGPELVAEFETDKAHADTDGRDDSRHYDEGHLEGCECEPDDDALTLSSPESRDRGGDCQNFCVTA